MDIQTLEITKINPAKYNPRKDLRPGDPEYEKLKKSITEFDMVEPLVWNKRTGNLVGGHQRLKILKELNIEKVEVSVVDLSEVKEKALNLALNKISGEWDFPMLKDLLEELDTGDFDMEITGFDMKEIEDLMTQFHVPGEGLTDDDAVPEPTESICRRGDLWSLGNHRLLCGDATLKEDVERLMGGEKAELCLTDPPYNVGFHYTESTNDKKSNEEYQHFCLAWFDIIKDISAVIMTPGPRNEYLYPMPRDRGVWLKRNATAGASVFNLRCCEPILFYGDGFRKRPFDFFDYSTGFPSEMTAARYAAGVKDKHAPAKPIKLWVDLLGMKPSGITLDVFGGNGTTLIACEKLGRRCYMMEIDEHYCDVIIARYEAFTGKQAVRIDG